MKLVSASSKQKYFWLGDEGVFVYLCNGEGLIGLTHGGCTKRLIIMQDTYVCAKQCLVNHIYVWSKLNNA